MAISTMSIPTKVSTITYPNVNVYCSINDPDSYYTYSDWVYSGYSDNATGTITLSGVNESRQLWKSDTKTVRRMSSDIWSGSTEAGGGYALNRATITVTGTNVNIWSNTVRVSSGHGIATRTSPTTIVVDGGFLSTPETTEFTEVSFGYTYDSYSEVAPFSGSGTLSSSPVWAVIDESSSGGGTVRASASTGDTSISVSITNSTEKSPTVSVWYSIAEYGTVREYSRRYGTVDVPLNSIREYNPSVINTNGYGASCCICGSNLRVNINRSSVGYASANCNTKLNLFSLNVDGQDVDGDFIVLNGEQIYPD